jgi:hypothetical protein
MAYVVVCLTSCVVAGLTLFSGFGLGTLLLPAFAVFFPADVAVAATALVHLANNLFKFALVGRYADWRVVARFGIPAAGAALVGAGVLLKIRDLPAIAHYAIGAREFRITPLTLVIGVLIIVFALFDLLPRLKRIQFDRRWLPAGGAVSGFFGGLSGHQGSLRSAFLIKLGLSREAYIGSGVMCAILVDVARIIVYGLAFLGTKLDTVRTGGGDRLMPLVWAATAAAFIGSFVGARLMKKVTIEAVQLLVGVMLVLTGLAIGCGLI